MAKLIQTTYKTIYVYITLLIDIQNYINNFFRHWIIYFNNKPNHSGGS